MNESCANEDVILDKISKYSHAWTFNPNDTMVSTIHAGRHQDVKTKDLAKLWDIGEHTDMQTLDITKRGEDWQS